MKGKAALILAALLLAGCGFKENDVRSESVTERFEFVQLSPSGRSAYAVSERYGLVNFAVTDGSLEKMPAGTMLSITWPGLLQELYPAVLPGVTSVTRADDPATPDRPDFVTENLPAVVEACRGKDDCSAEIDKLTGLTEREKEALRWLAGNELSK